MVERIIDVLIPLAVVLVLVSIAFMCVAAGIAVLVYGC